MAMRRRVFSSVGGFTSGIGRIGKFPSAVRKRSSAFVTRRVIRTRAFNLRESHSASSSAAISTHVAILLDALLGRGTLQGGGDVVGWLRFGPLFGTRLRRPRFAPRVLEECAFIAKGAANKRHSNAAARRRITHHSRGNVAWSSRFDDSILRGVDDLDCSRTSYVDEEG